MNPGLEKKTKKQILPKRNKTKKQELLLSHRTPPKIVKISEEINEKTSLKSSYSPSINKYLVSLKSVERKEVLNCNNERACSNK